jgi:hypothetical protein
MTLGNMRRLGVHQLVAYCLNPSCRMGAAGGRLWAKAGSRVTRA